VPVAEVVLHIGAFKTGTSFIQRALQANKQGLAEQGVLFPGRRWHDQVQGVRALTSRPEPAAPRESRGPDAWDALVDESRSWQGSRVVISMEFLSAAREDAVAAAVASFAPRNVRVVLGARDLSAAIPAQWQESLQVGGRTWTLAEYTDDVMRPLGSFTEGTTHFWRKHNWQKVLSRWGRHVGAEGLTVLTVPRPGADPHELWWRFGEAAGFDPTPYPIPAPANESLGAASLEVVRRMNVMALDRGMTTKSNRVHTAVLCKQVMAARRAREPRVQLPDEALDWTAHRTERLLRKVEGIGPRVVGSLDELRPQPRQAAASSTAHPEALDARVLLAAADEALENLSRAVGIAPPAAADGPADERLVSTIAALVDVVTGHGSSTPHGPASERRTDALHQ
jgi:hypothetical protein